MSGKVSDQDESSRFLACITGLKKMCCSLEMDQIFIGSWVRIQTFWISDAFIQVGWELKGRVSSTCNLRNNYVPGCSSWRKRRGRGCWAALWKTQVQQWQRCSSQSSKEGETNSAWTMRETIRKKLPWNSKSNSSNRDSERHFRQRNSIWKWQLVCSGCKYKVCEY